MTNTQSKSLNFLNVPNVVFWVFLTTVALHAIRAYDLFGWGDAMMVLMVFTPARYDFLGGGSLWFTATTMIEWLYGVDWIAEILSPVGYMFVHRDWIHVAINMTIVLAYGKVTAEIWGRWLWLSFYLLSGVFSAFFAGYISDFAFLAGASGGSSALIMAVIMPAMLGIGAIQKSTAVPQFLAWAGFLVVFPVVAEHWDWLREQMGFSISWQGHLGGMIFGAVMGLILPKK